MRSAKIFLCLLCISTQWVEATAAVELQQGGHDHEPESARLERKVAELSSKVAELEHMDRVQLDRNVQVGTESGMEMPNSMTLFGVIVIVVVILFIAKKAMDGKNKEKAVEEEKKAKQAKEEEEEQKAVKKAQEESAKEKGKEPKKTEQVVVSDKGTPPEDEQSSSSSDAPDLDDAAALDMMDKAEAAREERKAGQHVVVGKRNAKHDPYDKSVYDQSKADSIETPSEDKNPEPLREPRAPREPTAPREPRAPREPTGLEEERRGGGSTAAGKQRHHHSHQSAGRQTKHIAKPLHEPLQDAEAGFEEDGLDGPRRAGRGRGRGVLMRKGQARKMKNR